MLSVKKLCAGYGAADVISAVDLEVAPGTCHAIIGANGAGKTTLLAALAGLLPARAAHLALAHTPLLGASVQARVARGLVLCPEGRRVFGQMSVADNLAVGAHLAQSGQVMRARRAALYAKMPLLAERRHQLAGTMSGGEQQLVALGRALMAAPKVLLLDEPSLGLAPRAAKAVFAQVAALVADGLTVVLVEQNAALALRLAAHATVLAHGRVAVAAPAATLLGDPQVQRAYLGGT